MGEELPDGMVEGWWVEGLLEASGCFARMPFLERWTVFLQRLERGKMPQE